MGGRVVRGKKAGITWRGGYDTNWKREREDGDEVDV